MKTYLGNNKEVLKTFESNSIDSIVTDPPYELGFMGKSWDSSGIAYDVELWSELLRVLKPGGHLLAFSGTRTYHRMAVAIEDAGFEIRDMIEWVYGSGFPKSLNIGKAVDKLQGSNGIDTGIADPSYRDPNKQKSEVYKVLKTNKTIIALETENAKKYEGWGTALKPAHEPICMARKPLGEKTVAENCLKWGTGGINIDESRVESSEDMSNIKAFGSMPENKSNDKGFSRPLMNDKQSILDKQNAAIDKMKSLGRFPSNLIHDGSEEVMACFPETKTNSSGVGGEFGAKNHSSINLNGLVKSYPSNEGNASRFFKSIIYTSKPSKAERNKGCEPVFNLFEQSEGLEEKQGGSYEFRQDGSLDGQIPSNKNFHPTVKPIELMEYLIKMVTPKGGIVLDPFMGSGSTGCGAVKNGFDFVGIDMTPEYLEIAEKRIKRYLPL